MWLLTNVWGFYTKILPIKIRIATLSKCLNSTVSHHTSSTSVAFIFSIYYQKQLKTKVCTLKNIKGNFLKRFYLFVFKERGREGETEGDKHQCERKTSMQERKINHLPLLCSPTGYWTHNPGMFPDQASDWWFFTLWNDDQRNEPHQSGLKTTLENLYLKVKKYGIYIDIFLTCRYFYCFHFVING